MKHDEIKNPGFYWYIEDDEEDTIVKILKDKNGGNFYWVSFLGDDQKHLLEHSGGEFYGPLAKLAI